jgi:hypothetical protein
VGTVGVAVPARVGHELLALGLVLAPQLLPEGSVHQVVAHVATTQTRLHRWKLLGWEAFLKAPPIRPVVTRQGPKHPWPGLAAGGDLFVHAPEPALADLQMLELLWAEPIGRHQLKGKAPAGIRDGPHQSKDVLDFQRSRDDFRSTGSPHEHRRSATPQRSRAAVD